MLTLFLYAMALLVLALLCAVAQGLLAVWRWASPVRWLLLCILPALSIGMLLFCLWKVPRSPGWEGLVWWLGACLPGSALFGVAVGWLLGLDHRKRRD